MTAWQERAAALATGICRPQSRWHEPVRSVPRHVLVPRWYTRSGQGQTWQVHDGPSSEAAWLDAAYDRHCTLVTQVGTVHADHATPGAALDGWATSSSTLPGLVLDMYRHARLYEGADILDVGTGSGYGAALLSRRLGGQHVTSIDIDDYLTKAATCRLGDLGLRPLILTCDATGQLPGTFDQIVPMVSLPAIPASWLAALRPGGRLVFSLTGGSVLITADKTSDGGAAGRVEQYNATFMAARHGPGYPPRHAIAGLADDTEGEHVTTSPYPVVDPTLGWELDAILSVTTPGLTYNTATDPGTEITTTWMTHPDGSWARAAGRLGQPATVHQSGPRRLWDALDEIRSDWLQHGWLPLRGAHARIDPDGTCHLSQGDWHAVISPQYQRSPQV